MKYLVFLLAVGLAAAINLKGVKKTRHIYKRQAGQSFIHSVPGILFFTFYKGKCRECFEEAPSNSWFHSIHSIFATMVEKSSPKCIFIFFIRVPHTSDGFFFDSNITEY